MLPVRYFGCNGYTKRQQAEPIQGLGPAFGLREVGRKPVGAEHRQPVQSAVHAQANFIGMGHWRRDEWVANRVDWRLQAGGGHPYGALEGRRVPGEIARPASSLSTSAMRW